MSLEASASADGSQPQPTPILVLTFPGGSRLARPTDADGRFTFENLPPGQYKLALGVSSGFVADPADGVDVTVGSANGAPVSFVIRVDPQAPSTEPSATPADGAQSWTPIDPYQPEHLATLLQASQQSSCGVPWQVLAAIARVESDFGRNMSTSSAGAIGYGQFLPSTWSATVGQGDPYDYHDVLPAMAGYLCRAGAAGDLRSALYAYNHADWYVNLVLAVATEYDSVAPGEPSGAIIDAPLQLAQRLRPPYLRYVPGRNARHPAAVASASRDIFWINVPFPDANPVALVGRGSFATSADRALSMLRGGFQAIAPTPLGQTAAALPVASAIEDLAAAAQQVGLTAVDVRRLDGSFRGWSLDDVVWHLRAGHAVVVPAATYLLPGHAAAPRQADQVVVLTGMAGGDFVYNDPSFVSTIGYDLVMTPDTLDLAWGASSPAHHAAAIFRLDTGATTAPTLLAAEAAQAAATQEQSPTETPVSALPELVPADRDDRQAEPLALPTVAPAPVEDPAAVEVAALPVVPDAPVPAAPERQTLPVVLCLGLGSIGWLGLRRVKRARRKKPDSFAPSPEAGAGPAPPPPGSTPAPGKIAPVTPRVVRRAVPVTLKGAVRGSARIARGARRGFR